MTVQDFLILNAESIGPTGGDWNSCDALRVLNKARSALYGIDNWSGLITKVCVPCGASLIMPWFADRAVGAYKCKSIVHIATGEYWAVAPSNCCGDQFGITDMNQTSPVPVSNLFTSRLGIEIADFEDVGKQVTITYQNDAGSIITEVLTLGDFGSLSITSTSVRKVFSIKKPDSYGFFKFWSVNSDGDRGSLLFSAHPLETHLAYKQYCVPSCCCPNEIIVVDVKKKFIPFTYNHYNFPIDLPEHALSLAMDAITNKDKKTAEGVQMYNTLIASAINYLRKNEIKEKTTYGDSGHSDDYPSFT